MPRIKRWFPVSHSFNRDPEIRQLRIQFADWMGYVWAEMCSIGDMNDGIVKGSPEQIGESLAYISLTKRPSLSAKCITNALGFMQVCGWIEIQTDRVLIVNHAKYHRTEERKKVPPDLTRPEPEPEPNKDKNKQRYTIGQKPWEIEDQWLKDLISSQLIFAHVNGELLDYAWWEDVSTAINGIEPAFITREFGKMSAWYREHPERRPTKKGIRRFIRTWLERAKEQERRGYVNQKR